MNPRTMIIYITILTLIGVGCIEEKQTKYNLKYDFKKGESFSYDISSITKLGKNTITIPAHVETVVLDVTNDIIGTKTITSTIINNNKTESGYQLKSDLRGRILELVVEDTFNLPEQQPEIPNLVSFPEKEIQEGETWLAPIKRRGIFISRDNTSKIEYELEGINKYNFIALKTISIGAGKFECAEIKSDIDTTIYIKTRIFNKTANTTIVVKASGESCIDLRGGFLVKSTYNVTKAKNTDLSEAYRDVGFETFNREIKIESIVSTELVEKRSGV